MTRLKDILIARIDDTGPMTLADYMNVCLMHPEHGYYATRDPLGAGGDFITAPEVSQMFGELIGLSLAQAWLDQGAPNPFTLAEAGPGRGTLMADILRVTSIVPGFHAALKLHLIETSPTLRAKQQTTIGRSDINWHATFHTLPQQPLFFVANEFFDALPIRQFKRDGANWREHLIGAKNEALYSKWSQPLLIPALEYRLSDTHDGVIVELSENIATCATQLGGLINTHGGTALIIDYGDWRSLGDTFQAVAKHEPANPFSRPGDADLTAHVDFEALTIAAAPAKHSRLTPQGVFLERLGITQRAEQLSANLIGDALNAHIKAYQRLTSPVEMGTLFKVIALYPDGVTPPPGVEP
ncbi:class I SAM-dependent methyltransferase [Roseovarius sp. EL26]|uniref:class I SAM-dependent methyltransferase n=1 Tax=Roseovarius sp. EL26 TaxID=2126672 RepID=UPI000EA04B62|nr:SAM-dependent methyltransferase [Roseovarius sp. EL26]